MTQQIKDEEKQKRNDLIKSVIAGVMVAAFVIVALLEYDNSKNNINEEVTAPLVGVHVKGAVNKSGVYYVPIGTRVSELEKYTDGFHENADLDGVNLAGYVYDGQELYVPYMGIPEKGAVNLNTATYDELLKVSGIGDATANKIIEYRNARGTIEHVNELLSVLDKNRYEQIRESLYVSE